MLTSYSGMPISSGEIGMPQVHAPTACQPSENTLPCLPMSDRLLQLDQLRTPHSTTLQKCLFSASLCVYRLRTQRKEGLEGKISKENAAMGGPQRPFHSLRFISNSALPSSLQDILTPGPACCVARSCALVHRLGCSCWYVELAYMAYRRLTLDLVKDLYINQLKAYKPPAKVCTISGWHERYWEAVWTWKQVKLENSNSNESPNICCPESTVISSQH